MKKKILNIILIIIIVMIVSITTTYGASYLYNSNEVYYDNSESNLTSSDVQGAIDELYTEATNYSTINTRVTALENNKANKTSSPGYISVANSLAANNVYFTKVGNIVTCHIPLIPGIAIDPWESKLIANIPSGYFPITQAYFPIERQARTDYIPVYYHCSTDGKLELNNQSANSISNTGAILHTTISWITRD